MASIRRARRLPGVTTTFQPQPTIPCYIATSFVKPRAGLPDDVAKRQMASDMREASHREGGMTRDDLKLLGWTGAQIDRLGDAARVRAQAMSGMMA